MNREEYWFWLCNIPGVFKGDISRMLEVYQTPEAVFQERAEDLVKQGLISKKQGILMEQSRKHSACLTKLEHIRKEGIRFLSPEDPDFPEKLKLIRDPPYCLYLRGNLPDPALPSVGMVGARVCSEYGKEITLKFAKTLAARGVQIISGLAAGTIP